MPTIALITDSRHAGAAKLLRERLLVHWPSCGGGDPKVIVRHAGEGAPPAPTLDACIVLFPEDLGDTALYAIAREVRAAHVPLVTVGTGGGRDIRLATYDAYSQEMGADAGALAGLVAGLAARTPGVRQMDENLRYAQSVHESVARLVEQFQDDQLLAASIQRQFVSQEMPRMDGVSCAAMFRPVDFLSGDIYHVAQLDAEHMGFFLGDAMGHGLPAALMSLYIAGKLTQKEAEGGSYRLITPAESMTRLNRDLASTGCSNVRFATAVCGIMNVRTREIQLSAAGHPPPLLVGRGVTKKVEAGGALLGVMDDTVYEQTVFTLQRGETMILYSDGLEDSLNPRQAAEEPSENPATRHIDFLERVVAEVGGADPEKMFARFSAILDSESGSMHQVDDVTLVGIRAAA